VAHMPDPALSAQRSGHLAYQQEHFTALLGIATGKRSEFTTADTSLHTEPHPPCYLKEHDS
jgi:hypothetical protein